MVTECIHYIIFEDLDVEMVANSNVNQQNIWISYLSLNLYNVKTRHRPGTEFVKLKATFKHKRKERKKLKESKKD